MGLINSNISALRTQDGSRLSMPLAQGLPGQHLIAGLTDPKILEWSNSRLINCKNVTGGLIPAGTPVTAKNGDGTILFIEPLVNGDQFFGITNDSISINSEGLVVILGEAPYDTSPAAPGSHFYIDYDNSVKNQRPLQDHTYLGVSIDSLLSGKLFIANDAGYVETRNYKPNAIPDGRVQVIPTGNQALYCGLYSIGTGSEACIESNAELCIV